MIFRKKIKGIILFERLDSAEGLCKVLHKEGYLVDYNPSVKGLEIYKL